MKKTLYVYAALMISLLFIISLAPPPPMLQTTTRPKSIVSVRNPEARSWRSTVELTAPAILGRKNGGYAVIQQVLPE
jgi:hypothetical protein